MADEGLPPQPFGDHSDPLSELRTSGFDDVLGYCGACGKWKPKVGQWGGPNSILCCQECWQRTYPVKPGMVAVPGNPLNL